MENIRGILIVLAIVLPIIYGLSLIKDEAIEGKALSDLSTYGALLAQASRDVRDSSSAWPESLCNIPLDTLRAARAKEKALSLCATAAEAGQCNACGGDEVTCNLVCASLHGVTLSYNLGDAAVPPTLTINSKNHRAEWSWEQNSWIRENKG